MKAMPSPPRFISAFRPSVGVVAALAALLIAPAITRIAAQPITEGGSPLYVLAVRESVQGLRGGRNAPAQAAAQTPPAGAAAQTPAAASSPAASTNVLSAAQPTPEFLSRYYFCTNCQAYHLRAAPVTPILQQGLSNALSPATILLTNRVLLPTNAAPPAPSPGQ